jgi:hypothetical protein
MTARKKIRTFSGTHEFDPTVLVDTNAHEEGNADQIVEDIKSGRCPRCWGPLPTMPEYPAGSRVTHCRTIPICGPCGEDEFREAIYDGAMSSAGAWPIPVECIDDRRARFEGEATLAILAFGKDGDEHLITEDGAAPVMVINPCNTGGWAQYGFAGDDEDDREETP